MTVSAESRTTRSVPSPSPVVEKKVQPSLERLKPNDRLEPEIEKTWSNSATRLFRLFSLEGEGCAWNAGANGTTTSKASAKVGLRHFITSGWTGHRAFMISLLACGRGRCAHADGFEFLPTRVEQGKSFPGRGEVGVELVGLRRMPAVEIGRGEEPFDAGNDFVHGVDLR